MALFIKLLFEANGPKTIQKFNEQCRVPRETQEKLLKHILTKNKTTKFGADHHFEKINTYEDFKKVIPISDYDYFSDYIDASIEGKTKQLTVEDPCFYATTSGTTGKPKYISVTPESRSVKSQLLRVWFSKLYADHPGIFDGRILSVVSPEAESYTPKGIPCGAESGHGYRNMPKASKSAYSCPYDVYAIEDYETKYYTLLRIAAAQPVSLIFSCNPSTVLLLADRLGKYTESIIRDVRDGGISKDFPIPYKLAAHMKDYVKPDPKRAKILEQTLKESGGKLLPKFVWPKLAAIACWKGGSVGSYVSKFSQFYPQETAVRDIGYFASELRGSVPLSDETISGVLAVPTNFYEFYPADLDHKPGPEDLLASHELEKGKRYYIYVTTVAGLYRYDMNDIIEVTDFYQQTPMIRFIQKGKGVSSFTGEKLYEAQVIAAADKALASYEGNSEFIAAVGEMIQDLPQYTFLVEFDSEISDEAGKEIAQNIEEALHEINVEYHSKRKSERLRPALLRVIASGEFDRFRKKAVEGGKNDGQFKILKLTQDVKFGQNFKSLQNISAIGKVLESRN